MQSSSVGRVVRAFIAVRSTDGGDQQGGVVEVDFGPNYRSAEHFDTTRGVVSNKYFPRFRLCRPQEGQDAPEEITVALEVRRRVLRPRLGDGIDAPEKHRIIAKFEDAFAGKEGSGQIDEASGGEKSDPGSPMNRSFQSVDPSVPASAASIRDFLEKGVQELQKIDKASGDEKPDPGSPMKGSFRSVDRDEQAKEERYGKLKEEIVQEACRRLQISMDAPTRTDAAA